MSKGNVRPFVKRNKLPQNPSPTKQRLFLGVALAQEQNVKLAEAFDKEMIEVRSQIENVQVQLARVIVRGMVTEQLLKDKLGLSQEDIDRAVSAVAPMPTASPSEQGSASVVDSSTQTCNSPQDSVSEQTPESLATTCGHSEGTPVEQTCDRIEDAELSDPPVSL